LATTTAETLNRARGFREFTSMADDHPTVTFERQALGGSSVAAMIE